MRSMRSIALAAAVTLIGVGTAAAQQAPAANPLDVIPEKMPFAQPYGAPISLKDAQAAVAAAQAEADKRGWPMNIAVYDSGANLVTMVRMDGAQLASIAIAEHKARVAVKFRRETKALEGGVQNGLNYLLSLDDAIASRGGIPLVKDGKIIGAIGCSGGTGSQDEAVCKAGSATVK